HRPKAVLAPHSGLMPANLITLAHFWVSSVMNFPSSAGERVNIVAPRSASRAFILGSARAPLISLLRMCTISAGVSLGAPTSYHELPSVTGAESARRGQGGQRVRARRRSHRQCAQLAGPDIFDRRRWGLEHELNLPAKEVSQRRRRPAIRYVQHVDASHHLEQFAGDM